MRNILIGIFGWLSIMAFQNCEPQQFQAASLSENNKLIVEPPAGGVLGLYDYSSILFMQFKTSGGFMPPVTPEVTIVPLENESIQVTVSMVDYDGNIVCFDWEEGPGRRCGAQLDMSEERVAEFKSALFEASLMTIHKNPEDPIILDCGTQSLKFHLKNFSSHEYNLNAGVCNLDGALVIVGNNLQILLNEMGREGAALVMPTPLY